MRAYKESKANEEESEEESEDDGELMWDFACCKHIDENGETRRVFGRPGYDVYCTNCDPPCPEPNRWGDFEEAGIYWWRCNECIWQNGNMIELLCDECVERRDNPPKCGECGQKEKNVGELGSYEDREDVCPDCQAQMKADDDDQAKGDVESCVEDVNDTVEEATEAAEKAKKEGSKEAKQEATEAATQLEELAVTATEAAEVAAKRGFEEEAEHANNAAKKALEAAKAAREAAK